MAKIYKQPFAHEGDTIAIPDTSQPDGKMSSTDGWTPDYQLPKTDPNYKPVGRQEMNGVFKDVTEALGQVQVQGAASWSPDGAPYPVNAQVYHNGKQWIAVRANSVVPSEGEDWSAIVTDKQLATKADLSHTHTWSQVTGKPETATRWPTFAEVTDKPTIHTPIGVGQTWQDVTESRATETTYTNTTGRPIQIFVTFDPIGVSGQFLIDGINVVPPNDKAYYHVACIVPDGSTYRVGRTGAEINTKWLELR